MKEEHIIIIVSALGGLIGGMGMGGGTLLIPLLTLCSGLEQHLAQAINLMAFVPMSIIAVAIHKKNGYVRFLESIPVVVLALIGAVAGSFASRFAKGYVLRACFGGFLIALGVYQMTKVIVGIVKTKKQKQKRGIRSSEIGARN